MLHPHGFPEGLTADNFPILLEQTEKLNQTLGPENRKNIYFTLAHHNGLKQSKPSRNTGSFHYQTVLGWDLDHCTTNRAFEYLAAVASVLGVSPSHLVLICSGNGLQIYANLKTPIRSVKYFKEMKPAYNEICRKIDAEVKSRGLSCKTDPVVFDPARVMRLPGTVNSKPGQQDKECLLLQRNYVPLEMDLMVISGLDRLTVENISPEQIRRTYPKPDFEEVVKECRFVIWAMTHPEEVHEPHLFDLISLLATMPPGAKITYEGKDRAAIEVAEWIFTHASASRSLARGVFQDKWDSASRYGARKCTTIAQNWGDGCLSCPHRGKLPTPLALKSSEHIGSEEMGFWVMGNKGQYSEPNYSDVVKVYTSETSPVVRSSGFFFTFNGQTYAEEMDLRVESWLEKKMIPPDPVRDRHCKEFVKKAKRAVVLSKTSEEELFERSLVGKLNCQNGVLDIIQGILLPHSPQYGFQSMLPYDYLPDESSEFFLDWLGTVMGHQTELMEAVLDVMAYILWPTYDDHIFTFLIGEGANGKSTLIHIMEAMIGKGAYSTISIQQLGSNRFAAANLDGKMANFSEESSGYRMNLEDMNILLNLSAGGETQAEKKGEQGYTFKNRAKLIFSANKTPQFANKGDALTRRMLALPFEHKFTIPDSRVESRLIEEVPKIISLLVRRIQENLKNHGGRFVVSRGGQAAEVAQKKVLDAGDTAIEWAADFIESKSEYSEEQCVSISDAYAQYRKWCQENGYDRASSIRNFSHALYRSVIDPTVERHKNIVKVNGKSARVFKRTVWKDKMV